MRTRVLLIPRRPARAAAALLLFPAVASGQEAMYTAAATMPSPGVVLLREQVHYLRFGSHPRTDVERTEDIEWMTSIDAGLARGVSLRLDVPVKVRRQELEDGSTDRDRGVEDLGVLLKWRVLKQDTGGVDTLRVAILAGADVASGDDRDFSSQSVNPRLGGVVTLVRGRHGANADITYKMTTGGDRDDNQGGEGPADAIFHNLAYLYRIAPARYRSNSIGAWYATAELNGIWETNGDYELRFSPGVMYEGKRWAFEAMVQLPLYRDLDERAGLDLAVGLGLRITF
jgi:hypothetical protein